MSDIGKCPKCGCVIAYRFPIHNCKSVKVFDGDKQTLVKKITEEERDTEIERLSEIYEDVGADINGDIIFYREL
jgi:hypothetical protein